jgi:hypothetical protein
MLIHMSLLLAKSHFMKTHFFLESFGLSTSYAASFFTDFQHFQVDASQTSKRLAA